MKNTEKIFIWGTILFYGICFAVSGADNYGDAAVFAGNSDICKRYLMLGKLALENDDSTAAAEFFRQSLNGLKEQPLRWQAADLLMKSLLESSKTAEAEQLLRNTSAHRDPASKNALELMRARLLFAKNDSARAAAQLNALIKELAQDDALLPEAMLLQTKVLMQLGRYEDAKKLAVQMTRLTENNAPQRFKALENMVFLALENGDLALAKESFGLLKKSVPADLHDDLSKRLQKLEWLIACHDGKASVIEQDFLKAADSAASPDALIARIAYTIANTADDDVLHAVKFARMACKFAERAFRQEAYLSLIQLEVAGKLYQDALNDIEAFLKEYPLYASRHKLQVLAGELYVKLDRLPEAVKCMQKLCDDRSADLAVRCDAARMLAQLYQKSSQVQNAVKMYRFAIANTPQATRKALIHQELGEYLYQLGRYAEAVTEFQASVRTAESVKARFCLAQSLYMLKKYPQAQKELASVLKSRDSELKRRARYLDALLAEQLATADEAVGKFIRFADEYKQSKEAPTALFQAGVLAQKGSKYDAAELFNKYAALYPGEKAANALCKAVAVKLGSGDSKSAEKLLTQLAGKYPESKYTIASYFQLVDFLRENDRCSDAQKFLNEIETRYKTVHPELVPEILFDRALICRALKDTANMLKNLEELLQLHADKPIAPQAFFMLGDFKMLQGEFAAALKAFQQAQERSEGIFSIGCAGRAADAAYALYTQNRNDEYLKQAITTYSQLLRKSELPADFRYQTLYRLGRALEESKDHAGALRQYREILYSALLAKRSSQPYPAVWCSKALDEALKLLMQAVRESGADEAVFFKQEAERLLKTAGELSLPGENIKQQLETVQKTRPQ